MLLEPIVLASLSRRRQDYFRLLGLPFSVMTGHCDEKNHAGLPAREHIEDVAQRKARCIVDKLSGKPPLWVFAADTMIVCDGEALGKPTDIAEAEKTLRCLAGRTHSVVTAMALYRGAKDSIDCRSVESVVEIAPLSDAEIAWYIDTGEWQGAAGGYRIQGLGGCFVRKLTGSYSGVVGLPLHEFRRMLIENDYPYFAGENGRH